MKRLILFSIFSGLILFYGCKKDTTSERFKLLTGPVWTTESLLANGVDASGTGQILEKFKGDAKFNEDGTGYFGLYDGTWYFAFEETQIVIKTDSLPIPLTSLIDELTSTKFKISTSYSSAVNPAVPIAISMTFRIK
jgi:hypothetical protein